MRALLVTVLLVLPTIASAQTFGDRVAQAPRGLRVTFIVPRANPAPVTSRAWTPPIEKPRPSVLMRSLYVTTAVLQGLDVHSTLVALDRGARERNPLISAIASHPVAFVAVKAGVAAGLICAGRRLARQSRLQAALVLVAVNSAYAVLTVHNYQVAHRLR